MNPPATTDIALATPATTTVAAPVATAPKTTTLATPQPQRATFRELVEGEKFKGQLAAALPKHLTPDRFIRVLLTATMKNPLLLQCTQESLFKGILDVAAVGLEIDGRRAHLIPYKNNRKNIYEAQLIVDYKGLAELIMRSGLVSTIHADIVCENDVFEYDLGEVKKHTIDLRADRGAMYAVYCRIAMKDGSAKCDVMSKFDVERVRRSSRASGDGPWVQHYDEMAKKTVFRRASKWVPLSAEIRSVVESEGVDDEPVNVTPKAGLAGLIGAPELPAAPAEPVAAEADAPPTATETTATETTAKG